ncbi:AraC-like DNA-binding protein [Sphaerotilus hippei]|uniref:AraC-like DNA-binding protein n=2 Tax=Sphaerotilus hippei TaxID=744406 RepID=A0A318H624_9BURK|nr:AraC-like DNA-binding protein [Sphaerotilus hippei]
MNAATKPRSMQKNQDPCASARRVPAAHQGGPDQARALREGLAAFALAAARGELDLLLPSPAGALVAGGRGHFHLGAELFLQLAGRTDFEFPNARLALAAGQAMVVPAQVLHDERVQGEGPAPEQAFRNIVVYADAVAVSCHLAHEAWPGLPDILHLEARHHAQSAPIQSWLAEAARLGGPTAGATRSGWPMVQARALVGAAIAGVLRVLDEPDPADPARTAEPALLSRVRMLIQNQLGEHTLSVRQLAGQCGCTADHLSHLVRRHTGEHLAALISRLRMERAARLLADSTLSGKEIAWACGFAGPSYFIRTFRSHFGMTPQAWRAAAGTDSASHGLLSYTTQRPMPTPRTAP